MHKLDAKIKKPFNQGRLNGFILNTFILIKYIIHLKSNLCLYNLYVKNYFNHIQKTLNLLPT